MELHIQEKDARRSYIVWKRLPDLKAQAFCGPRLGLNLPCSQRRQHVRSTINQTRLGRPGLLHS